VNNEVVQYYVVNEDLKLSPGKLASQIAHAATISTINMVSSKQARFPDYFEYYVEWYQSGMKKMILRGSENELETLVESGFYAVHEKGVAEILEGKLSVVALPPMPRLLSKRFVSQFKRY
jgi:peptidyl-tRNA hydrolase